MKPRTVHYRSFLAPHIRHFFFFRQRLGYVNSVARYYLFREFDRHVLKKGITRFDQLDAAFANDWMFSKPELSSQSKRLRLSLLRSLCHFLVRQQLMKDNPAMRVPQLRKQPFTPHIFSLKEIQSLLVTARNWKTKHTGPSFMAFIMEPLLHLIYTCGLRINEALRLELKDIDFHENTLSLWKTKFHKERLIPFSDKTAVRLRTFLDLRSQCHPFMSHSNDPVFCNRFGRYSPVTINSYFRRLLKRCRLLKERGPRIHDLRHTFAVHRLYKWYQEGVDIQNKLSLLTTYMGHVNIEDTQVYLTVCRALLREGNKRFRESSEHIPSKILNRALRKFRRD